jgi:serine protease Do
MSGSLAHMARVLAALAVMLLAPFAASAEPADIDAAARGVVRVVIVDIQGEQIVPLSHGTGFAVGPERIVTNAHVVAEARRDQSLAIGIVPSDGGDAVYGRLITVSQHNDLALLATTSPMRLPPLTVSGNPTTDSGSVTAVGFPMNVDRAQGLSMSDLFRAQPPVKSRGSLAGRRPIREFDSILHTAPIARGNSGGPLLDECGRVIGVNSFGTESGPADSEFFFAVSTRELLPFLRANGVTPQVNSLPCRSLSDLEAEERRRAEAAQRTAQARAAAEEQVLARRRDEARRDVEFDVLAERENDMMLTLLLLLGGLAAAGLALHAHDRHQRENTRIGAGLAALALTAAALVWLTRPGFGQVDDRLEDLLRSEMAAADTGTIAQRVVEGALVCVLDPERSRITGPAAEDLPFAWTPDGCVNGRTQYGAADGVWSRVFVPDSEAVVSVNRFDPALNEYRVERYLLGREALQRARTARREYTPPECGAGEEAARELGARQASIISLLPEQPNERLVYTCSGTGG